MPDIPCILCNHPDTRIFHKDERQTCLKCPRCHLVFVSPDQRLTPAEEVERYNRHENDPKDPRYRNFLGRLFKPMNERLKPGSSGLDFGSGPGPALHLMFMGKGHRMNIYDPFYANNPEVFDETYDFITATEVAEHLFRPGEELNCLWNCLHPGGYLGIMTKRLTDGLNFPDWHYRRDDTHVAFYSAHTFEWLAELWNASLELIGDDVAIFQKTG